MKKLYVFFSSLFLVKYFWLSTLSLDESLEAESLYENSLLEDFPFPLLAI